MLLFCFTNPQSLGAFWSTPRGQGPPGTQGTSWERGEVPECALLAIVMILTTINSGRALVITIRLLMIFVTVLGGIIEVAIVINGSNSYCSSKKSMTADKNTSKNDDNIDDSKNNNNSALALVVAAPAVTIMLFCRKPKNKPCPLGPTFTIWVTLLFHIL